MRHPFLIALALALFATPAIGQGFVQSPAYKECTALATSNNPQLALVKADEWLKIDDGFAAYHCRAMALYGMGQFPQAAEALAITRDKIPAENIALRTYVARQGAKAWVDAHQTPAALALLAAQINDMRLVKSDNATEAKLTSDLLLDRARLLLKYGKASDAVQDLDHAVSLTPLNDDVLLERALAFEQLGDLPLAKQDAQAVLRLNPGQAKAAELLRRVK